MNMTNIEWYWADECFGIKAEGHAGYKAGSDIVCSAVSALLQTLYAGLEMYCFAPVEHEQKSGIFVLRGRRGRETKEVKVLFDSILFGLELIEREYPENVKLTRVKGVGGNIS